MNQINSNTNWQMSSDKNEKNKTRGTNKNSARCQTRKKKRKCAQIFSSWVTIKAIKCTVVFRSRQTENWQSFEILIAAIFIHRIFQLIGLEVIQWSFLLLSTVKQVNYKCIASLMNINLTELEFNVF